MDQIKSFDLVVDQDKRSHYIGSNSFARDELDTTGYAWQSQLRSRLS